jgi:hypothetical protein
MLEITPDDAFELSPNILIQKIEELEKYWVFNIETGEHYSLNETSFWILEKLASQLTAGRALTRFLSDFAIDEETGRTDFVRTIDRFLEEGILRRR